MPSSIQIARAVASRQNTLGLWHYISSQLSTFSGSRTASTPSSVPIYHKPVDAIWRKQVLLGVSSIYLTPPPPPEIYTPKNPENSGRRFFQRERFLVYLGTGKYQHAQHLKTRVSASRTTGFRKFLGLRSS
jgi:hypothetical protein